MDEEPVTQEFFYPDPPSETPLENADFDEVEDDDDDGKGSLLFPMMGLLIVVLCESAPFLFSLKYAGVKALHRDL